MLESVSKILFGSDPSHVRRRRTHELLWLISGALLACGAVVGLIWFAYERAAK